MPDYFIKTLIVTMLMTFLMPQYIAGQQSPIVLDQGAVVGLKVFPDSARTAVYAFLGIPYAQPPTGQLRFAPPRPHNGWNWTLQAMSMKPICPQLTNTIYDETTDGKSPRPPSMSEDCLYLNVWVPEAGMRYGNLPVVVIITGEEMSYDWPRNRASGLDFASDGVVVVSVQYRTNIFGWLAMDNDDLAGNYGLQDLELALKWIHQNVRNFGGRPTDLTLLGHGTGGAACALAVVARESRSEQPTIGRLILMSGGNIEMSLGSGVQVLQTSRTLIQKLGCHFEERGQPVADCLRTRSVSDLLKSFESIYHSNTTFAVGPIVSASKLGELLSSSQMPTTLMGITSNEGAFVRDYWLDLAREGYEAIRSHVNASVLPGMLRQLGIESENTNQIAEALNWRYFSGDSLNSAPHLLNSLQRLISEAFFEAPFYRLLDRMTAATTQDVVVSPNVERQPAYAYIFDSSNSMDMRGKVNLFGGATHSADLPLLLGPGMFQQIARRRFTAAEDKLCRKIRAAFVSFVKEGNPTPGRIFDAWLPYTTGRQFIYNLGDAVNKAKANERNDAALSSSFEANLPQIEQLLKNDKRAKVGQNGGVPRSNRNEYSNPYQMAGDGQSEYGGQRSKAATTATSSSSSYLSNQQDSGYALHLRRVYGFWHVLLPNMAAHGEGQGSRLGRPTNQRVRLMEATADAARYRRGFFVMLGLVCVLLSILGLCVYLLQRDPLRSPSHASKFCL